MTSLILASFVDSAQSRPITSPQAPRPTPTFFVDDDLPQRPSPYPKKSTISAQLDLLRAVHAVVQNEGSEMPADEVLEAVRLVRDMGMVLDRELSERPP